MAAPSILKLTASQNEGKRFYHEGRRQHEVRSVSDLQQNNAGRQPEGVHDEHETQCYCTFIRARLFFLLDPPFSETVSTLSITETFCYVVLKDGVALDILEPMSCFQKNTSFVCVKWEVCPFAAFMPKSHILMSLMQRDRNSIPLYQKWNWFFGTKGSCRVRAIRHALKQSRAERALKLRQPSLIERKTFTFSLWMSVDVFVVFPLFRK